MITSVTYLNADLIKITLNARVRIDSLFLDPANWVISAAPGYTSSTSVACVTVLTPADSSLVATDTVFLQTTLHTLDAVYEVRYLQLTDTTGFPVLEYQPSVFPYRTRSTKVDQILKSLPNHFDKRASSTIRSLVTAIGIQDDFIGGARNDAFRNRPIGFGGDPVEFVAPYFTVNPSISGSTVVGSVLTCDSGVYLGTSPISISFQWKRAGVDIVGEVSDIYITTGLDAGLDVSCTVSLSNVAGSVDFTTAVISVAP